MKFKIGDKCIVKPESAYKCPSFADTNCTHIVITRVPTTITGKYGYAMFKLTKVPGVDRFEEKCYGDCGCFRECDLELKARLEGITEQKYIAWIPKGKSYKPLELKNFSECKEYMKDKTIIITTRSVKKVKEDNETEVSVEVKKDS